MELPILKYLPLSDDAQRIVLRFLRKPHPIACLIQALTFEYQTWEFDDDSTRDFLVISGPHLRILRENVFHSVLRRTHRGKYITPRLRTLMQDEEWELALSYHNTTGECGTTSSIRFDRMFVKSNADRWDERLGPHSCPKMRT